MPHSLCFTGLQLFQNEASDAAVVGDNSNSALFIQEENKKSSFQLQAPYALYSQQQVDNNTVSSSIAMASITSCVNNNTDDDINGSTTQTQDISFLFGGFELLVNTKTVEVYVVRSGVNTNNTVSTAEEETYLTTCKGVPQRDLPPLISTPCYVDGSEINGKESTEKEDITFYKFVFVSPGGPKPHFRVKLKFVRSSSSASIVPVIIRTLKVKGRLSESIASTTNTSSSDKQSMPFGGANSANIPSNEMNSIASMMAMMGGNNASSSMPMQMQMNSMSTMQQMHTYNTQQHNMYTQQQQQLHQQQNNHQQEKNQAELISSIAGLGMYLKSYEERSEKKLEALLSGMEERIMNRLDTLTQRLDVIEQSIQREQSNREEVVNEEQSNREEVDEGE